MQIQQQSSTKSLKNLNISDSPVKVSRAVEAKAHQNLSYYVGLGADLASAEVLAVFGRNDKIWFWYDLN